MTGFTYIIEHMEEHSEVDKNVPEWVQLEYKHMRTLAGPNSKVLFTSLPGPVANALSETLSGTMSGPLADYEVSTSGVIAITKGTVPLEKICLLDPKAEKELNPEDGDGQFECFLFGGILGDDPPRDRTGELRALGFPGRRLGPVQMTTDTALGVTKLVVENKQALEDIAYTDFPTIKFNANESVEMPFRYIKVNGQPSLPPGMRELLYRDLDKGLEFD